MPKRNSWNRVYAWPTRWTPRASNQGRGPSLCMSSLESDKAKFGFSYVGIYDKSLATRLITVVPTGRERETSWDLISAFVPEDVIQNIAESAQDSLIESPITWLYCNAFATLCKRNCLASVLAAKGGLIWSNWSKKSTKEEPHVIAKPHYLLRLGTRERLWDNTTAIAATLPCLNW